MRGEEEVAARTASQEHRAEAAGGAEPALRRGARSVQRSLLVPVLVAVVVALIGGVFGFAVVGFNTLRDDMREGFAQVETRFVQIDARFAQIDERLAEVNLVLLDHTDRLARIEAVHGPHTHTHSVP